MNPTNDFHDYAKNITNIPWNRKSFENFTPDSSVIDIIETTKKSGTSTTLTDIIAEEQWKRLPYNEIYVHNIVDNDHLDDELLWVDDPECYSTHWIEPDLPNANELPPVFYNDPNNRYLPKRQYPHRIAESEIRVEDELDIDDDDDMDDYFYDPDEFNWEERGPLISSFAVMTYWYSKLLKSTKNEKKRDEYKKKYNNEVYPGRRRLLHNFDKKKRYIMPKKLPYKSYGDYLQDNKQKNWNIEKRKY